MTNATDDKPQTDWSQLAKEALDLWQNHLTSLATDQQAKEEMARFIAPMSEMAANWTAVMQQGFQGMMNYASTAQQAAAEAYAQATEAAESTAPQPPRAEAKTTETEMQAPAATEAPVEVLQPIVETPVGTVAEAATAPAAATPLETPTPAEAKSPREYDQPVSAGGAEPAPTVESVSGPDVGSVPTQPEATRGRASSSDGSRSLAELAGRLAALERELDQLRPKTRRRESEPAADESDRRVAGADKGANSA